MLPYLEAYHYDYTEQDLSDDYITEHDYNGESTVKLNFGNSLKDPLSIITINNSSISTR